MSPLATGLAMALCYALGLVGYRLAKRPPPAARRFDEAFAEVDEAPEPLLPRIVAYLSHRTANRVLPLLGQRRRGLIQHRLTAAGSPMTPEQYAGHQAAYTVLGACAGFILFIIVGNPVVIVALTLGGWLGPGFLLARKAKRRQAQIERDLPDFLDILSVIVGAGSGFRPGLARVSAALGGPLDEEFTLTLRQMDLGASRRAAFRELRDRNDCEPLESFVSSLLHAEELGTPLGDVLGEIALDMRREFQQNARRKAAQAAPRVSLIVTMIIVPGAVILIITALFVGADIDIGGLLG